MLGYFLKRLIFIIPTIIVVSVIGFFLLQCSPNDPVDTYLSTKGISMDGEGTMDNYDIEYKRTERAMNRHLPLFYFGIASSAESSETMIPYPVIKWHGTQSQYHMWAGGFVRGEFGVSLYDGKKISTKVFKAFRWTFALVVCAFTISLLIGIPLGVFQAIYPKNKFSVASEVILYVVYGMPVFWIATMLIVFFTTPDYGSWTDIFPSVGIFRARATDGLWTVLISNAKQLILPVFCIVLGGITYLSRMMRSSLMEEKNKPYVIAAIGRGFTEKYVWLRHALPNALLPIVTVVFASFASAMAGTVIIEMIFNIPGMGRLMMESIYNTDWPLMMTLLILLSLITILFYFLSDVVYALLNPKIKF